MQLTPRYLVDNKINVISTDATEASLFVVEYRPVYSRQLKVYRGIDNTLQFRLFNSDQKPVLLSTNIPWIVIFDEHRNKIIERACTITDDQSSTASLTKGTFQVILTENDLLNVQQQYLSYNIYMRNADNTNTITYSNQNFESAGSIFLDSLAFPGPKKSTSVTNFYVENSYWVAGSDDATKIEAQPGINGNDALHTVAIYSSSYIGTVEIQATLENQITGNNNWSTINTITFTGSESMPVPANFNGIFNYIRFKFSADPTDKISKILIRN